MPRLENGQEDTHGPRVPRSSVEVLANTLAEHRAGRRRRAMVRGGAGLVLIVVALWSANVLIVSRPVSAALASDTATARIRLDARFQWYVDPMTLILDLRAPYPATPEQAFRAVLVAADAMRREGRSFGRVVLARAGTPVYVLSGSDFRVLGGQFASTARTLDVLRSIPAMLRGTAGSGAFGPLGAPMADPLGEWDLTAAAGRWLGRVTP